MIIIFQYLNTFPQEREESLMSPIEQNLKNHDKDVGLIKNNINIAPIS